MIRALLSLLILITLLSPGIHLSAQPFQLDTSGKITFVEVVEADSMRKEELFQNATLWFEGFKKKVKTKMTRFEKDSINSKLSGDFQFMVYSQSGILSKTSGAVSYTLTIEMKDNRYRYVFTDFIFHHYKQNRNYEYVETGVTKPLEEVQAKGWQKLWDSHRLTAYNKTGEEIKSLKTKILEREKQPVAAPLAVNAKKTDW